MNLSELKIDDRVGFYRTHNGTFMSKGFGVVTKINGHGHITIIVCGRDEPTFKTFDKYGKERKAGYSALQLTGAEWLKTQLAEDKTRNDKQGAVRDLLKYFEGRRCGNGNYVINHGHKEEIKKLVDAL